MKKKLNIAILDDEFLPIPAIHGGAVEVLVEELVKGNELDYKFNIDLYTVSDPLLDKIKYKHCNIIQIYQNEVDKFSNITKKGTSKFGFAINEKMKDKKYDFILVENSMRIYNTLNRPNDRLIFHLHCDVDSETERPKWIAEKIVNTSYCTLSCSKFVANALNNIVKSEKNRVLYNCIDFNVFNLENVDYEFVNRFKIENNIKENDFCFMLTGRICPEKGVLQLIEAFKKIKKKYKDVKLIIVGRPNFGKDEETEYTKMLKRESKEIENDIIFTGLVNHDKMPTILSISDCIVIPSMWEEAFGVVAIEAMAMKKAVISTTSGGLVEVLNEECAIFAEKKENVVENLFVAMEKMVNNRELAIQLGDNGYKRVHSIYDFDSKNYFNNFCRRINFNNLLK